VTLLVVVLGARFVDHGCLQSFRPIFISSTSAECKLEPTQSSSTLFMLALSCHRKAVRSGQAWALVTDSLRAPDVVCRVANTNPRATKAPVLSRRWSSWHSGSNSFPLLLRGGNQLDAACKLQ
jgi:hypothetical protein